MRAWNALATGAILLGLLLGSPDAARAASLSDLLVPAAPFGGTVVADPFVTELQRDISRGTDFHATATTPGFTYRFNPEIGAFEQTSASLGPAFLDRAQTIGKGRWDFGVSYLYANFQEIDGDDLEDLQAKIVFDSLGLLDVGTVQYERFELNTNAFYFSGTYGVLDDLDVNVLMPLFRTSLSVRDTVESTGPFGTVLSEGSDVAVGPGDLQLRAKYRFWDREDLSIAAGLALRVPTGDEDDFQGVGEVTLTPNLVGTYVFGRNDVHAFFGPEFVTGDLDQSRANYGLGVSIGIFDWLTGNLDIIGSSELGEDTITTFVRGRSPDEINFASLGSNVMVIPQSGGSEIVTTLARDDFVDATVGFKVNIAGSAVVFASAIVPLTEDGVRARVIPAVGFEVSF